MRALRKSVPKNDHVKNKDRQDLAVVLKISSTGVTNYLREIGFIGHTVIPETSKFTNNNKVGMHSNPSGLLVGSYGHIYMLNFDTKTILSKITKFKLHDPIDKFETIASGITVNSICYFEGRVFYCGLETPLSFVTTNNSKLDIEKMKSKSNVCIFRFSRGLTLDKRNSLNNLKANIYNHLKKAKEHFYQNKLGKNMLQLPDVKAMPKFEAFCICDNDV